jgi:hypothetical protein
MSGDLWLEPDYPAAHSADTSWWGVDKHGHVALFSTGEAGAMPDRARDEAPAEPPEGERAITYDHADFDNWISGPYQREPLPERPWRLEPDAVKKLRRKGLVQFDQLDFRRELVLQPAEHMECMIWGGEWVSATGEVAIKRYPDEDEPELSLPPAPEGPVPLPLLERYVRGERGAREVLRDWCLEQGRLAPEQEMKPGEWLDELLWTRFEAQPRAELERVFVRRVLAAWPDPAPLLERLEGLRPAGPGMWDDRDDAMAPLQLWRVLRDGRESCQPAWALWALARELPLVPARTARQGRPLELLWQLQQVLDRLSEP